jgi:hypothetical protein
MHFFKSAGKMLSSFYLDDIDIEAVMYIKMVDLDILEGNQIVIGSK